MNIEKIALSISQSFNEKNFNSCIAAISEKKIEDQKNICQNIFKIFDTEVDKEGANQAFLRTLIAIPVELAIFNQNNKNTKNQKVDDLIDFISSHFLARSNGTHESLRMAMMLFFVHIRNQAQWKHQRILERFGENILSSVFNIYCNDKAKTKIAFSFLSENMESFLSVSPHLAEMTNSFLQTYMFKQPEDFIEFINEYKNYILTHKEIKNFFVIHLSFLIRQAFEVEHSELSLNLIKIFFEYVYSFSEQCSQNNLGLLSRLMLQSKNMHARECGLYIQKELQNNQKISYKIIFKNICSNMKRKVPNPMICKRKKIFENISLFQKLFFLF